MKKYTQKSSSSKYQKSFKLLNDFQLFLMKTGHSDIVLFLDASHWAINDYDYPHPYAMTSRYWFLENFFEIACPLPQRIPSFYNIVTPLSEEAWVFVSITNLLVAVVFLIINQVYKSFPEKRSVWKWYVIKLSVQLAMFLSNEKNVALFKQVNKFK